MSGIEALATVGAVAAVLLIAGVPLAFTFAIVGTLGTFLVSGMDDAINILKFLPHRVVSTYLLTAVPMFLLFGYLAESTGIVHGTYRAASKWFGHLPGGLGVATTFAAGMFGAASGSIVSATALFGRVSVPELRRAGYSKGASVGCVAAGGLLAATIPPSIPLVIYAMLTRESVIKLFAAGVIPGILQVFVFSLVVMLMSKFGKGIGPPRVPASWAERFKSITGIWPIMLVATAILGSIYGGIATVTESASAGTLCAFIIILARRELNFEILKYATIKTINTVVVVLTILVGGLTFATFLVLSGVTSSLVEIVASLPLPNWLIMVLIVFFYAVVGMFVDGSSMLVITVPVLAPIAAELGYSLIWFGVLTVLMIEAGAVTPPVGLNIFVLKAQVPDATLEECFRGGNPILRWYCTHPNPNDSLSHDCTVAAHLYWKISKECQKMKRQSRYRVVTSVRKVTKQPYR